MRPAVGSEARDGNHPLGIEELRLFGLAQDDQVAP